MKRFSFRLERVLQLRITTEQERARALGEAQLAEETLRRTAEASAARYEEAVRQARELGVGVSAAGSLSNLQIATTAVRVRAVADATAHREAVGRVESERALFNEARQARMAIERLREQQRADWEREVGRLEQNTLDEVALRIPRGAERTA